MRIRHIIWLTAIEQKLLWKHSVKVHEVEELIHNQPRYQFIEKGNKKGEDVYAALGQTDAGRYLICYFIRKSAKDALVLSARDMSKPERKMYGRK